MKKSYIRYTLALAVTVASFMGMTNTVSAKTETVEWTVNYTGEGSTGFSSNYTEDLKDKISSAMPGDTLVYKANYKNDSEKTMDFYLSADVLSSLEDDKTGKTAAGGAYTYKLTYDSGDGEKNIYDSETVGGDNDVQKGLNQVKNNNAFVSVGRLNKKQDGVVTITIKLDGNSQDNSYMTKLAQLNVQFAVTEPTDIDPIDKTVVKKVNKVKPVVYTIPGGSEVVNIDDGQVPLDEGFNPKTGDSILPLVICGIAFLAGLVLIGLYFIFSNESDEEVA
ncbi:hypothetical protein [Pseudobutyrivibrio ruminis]|uniref:hypothetical protein n=1 Tax=Pseudobutyrivibrio ruminis TaxID=46206 RepID=UPI000400AD65|nr:hypothetical protein [Pseudobutyrivibrio ruminis]